MCLATLHVSNLPCKHRYYKLLTQCSPKLDLSSCTKRIALEGWEQREDGCAFCGSSSVVFAQPIAESPTAYDSPISRTYSSSSSSTGSRRGSSASRRASAATTASGGSLSCAYDSRVYRLLAGPPIKVNSAESESVLSSVLPGSRSSSRRNSSAKRVNSIIPDIRSGTAKLVSEENGGTIIHVRSSIIYDKKDTFTLPLSPVSLDGRTEEEDDGGLVMTAPKESLKASRRMSWIPKRSSIISTISSTDDVATKKSKWRLSRSKS